MDVAIVLILIGIRKKISSNSYFDCTLVGSSTLRSSDSNTRQSQYSNFQEFHMTKARKIFNLWLDSGRFPFSSLGVMLILKRSNEIWEKMLPSIWELCLWLVDQISFTMSKFSDTIGYDNYNTVSDLFLGDEIDIPNLGHVFVGSNTTLVGLCQLVYMLYISTPNMREMVVSSLLSRCYNAGKKTVLVNRYSIKDFERVGLFLFFFGILFRS